MLVLSSPDRIGELPQVGVVRTNFGGEGQAWFFSIISGAVRPFLKTPAQGAQTSIYLASSRDVEGVRGHSSSIARPKAANRVAYDSDVTGRLWQVSIDLVGLAPETA